MPPEQASAAFSASVNLSGRALASLADSRLPCGSTTKSVRGSQSDSRRGDSQRRVALSLGGLTPSVTNFNEDEAAGSCSIYGCGDRVDLLSDHAPVVRAQDKHCHSTTD